MDTSRICPSGRQWISRNRRIACLTALGLAVLLATTLLAVNLHRSTYTNDLNVVSAPLVKESNWEYTMDDLRLPKDVKPTNYVLELKPNLENKTFMGTVTITMQVLNETEDIKLHIKDLNIDYISLKRDDNETIAIMAFKINKVFELLEVKLVSPLSKVNHELRIEFNGRLDKGIVGLYASSLKSDETMIASKFQPTYARQAFPCFDEPDFKATYDITLVKPTDYIALSNMNEISKKRDKETNSDIVKFATSVPMSTYLVCFVICNFDHKETVIDTQGIGKNFTLRSFAQKNETHKIDFAQDIGKRATEFYIKYYNVPYPLPKLDMIAIPDYVSGATEHWGLITYRETSFLVDQKTASSKNKMSVANTIAHELAHMWFGNLVTMKWWDEVWLNEGFASYMQVKALNALEPSWTMLDQFLTKTLHPVLVTDSKVSSHPIVQKVDTPDQITAIFDSISYNKGASILRMLEGFVGEEKFRRAISEYLQRHQFGNTVTGDLLACLDEFFTRDYPDLNLTHIMNTWTKQMGYPVLNVAKGMSEKKLIVTQRQFLLDPSSFVKQQSVFNYRWFVPITYKTNRSVGERIVWFPENTDSVEIPLELEDKWIKLNNNQVGYYRVNYSAPLWAELIKELKAGSEKLTISDRTHLLNDAFALADADALPYELALDLSTYLHRERAYVPWDAASAILNQLADKLVGDPAHDDIEHFIQHLIKPLYDNQTWDAVSLSVINGLLRTKVLSMATVHHLPEAEAKARKMFLTWLNSGKSAIQPDLRDFVYYCGMKQANASEWNKLWEVYLKESDVHEQSKLRLALAAPADASILKKYLSLAWDEKNIRSQDYLTVLTYISANPAGAPLVWEDVRARWPQLVERFTLNSRYLGALVPAITGAFNTETQLKEMESFFEKYPDAGAGETGRRRALENVRNNIKWTRKHRPIVAAWLKDHLKNI